MVSFTELNRLVSRPVEITGKPRYLADFVGESVLRTRTALLIALPLWVITLGAHHAFMLDTYQDTAAKISENPERMSVFMALAPQALMIVVSCLVVVLMFKRQSVASASRLSTLVVVILTACEGTQVYLSGGHPNHVPSFSVVSVIAYALAPLGTRQRIFSILLVYLLPALIFLVAGLPWIAWTISLPFGAALIGSAVYYRSFGNFRMRRLLELQLRRRTILAETQKAELERQYALVEREHKEAERQRARALKLLAGALTAPVARAYERDGYVKPSNQTVVVIFCDAVGFTDYCKNMQPERIVSEMQRLWTIFDKVCLDEGLAVEPLRAEGDARMAVAGLGFEQNERSIHQAAIAATLAMLRFREFLPSPDEQGSMDEKTLWPMRIGINIGPVTSGVIDTNVSFHAGAESDDAELCGRLWFDVWGDTVNIAARLAQSAKPNQILVRARLLWELGGLFTHGPLHTVKAKNSVIPDMAEITGIDPLHHDSEGRPNAKFWDVYHSKDYRPVKPAAAGNSS